MKPGYKQTEVGVIPEDWEEHAIGDFRPFVTSGSRGWAAYYSDYGSPFVRITNLSRESIYLDFDDLRFVSLPEGNSEGVRTGLRDGDLLISITADIGIVGIVSPDLPKPAYINQHIALVRFDPNQTSSKYVTYYLASERPQRSFRSLTDSGAKAGMNLTTVQQIHIAVPPTLAEQEAIAGALSDADALIDSLEQLIAKKRLLKQGAMQDLLTGKKRLPGFEGEWEVKRLGEVVRIRNERINPQAGQPSTFCIELEHLDQGSGILLGHTKTSETSSLKCVFQKGDVLFGKLRSYLRKHWHATRDGVCSTEIWVLIPSGDAIVSPYLYQIVQTDTFIDATSLSFGTHMPRSDWKVVRELEVGLPTTPEQTAIAAILSDMDAGIAAIEAKLAKARQVKQGMMQELLTGKTRLV